MRIHDIGVCFAALMLPISAIAAEPAFKPTDGWVQLFDGNSTFGWLVDGDVRIQDGFLVIGQEKPGSAYPTAWFGLKTECILEFQGGVIRTDVAATTVKDTGKTCRFTRKINGKSKQESFDGVDPNRVSAAAPNPSPGDKRDWTLSGTPELPMKLRAAWIRVVDPTPLFDGQSLAGWKRYVGDPKREKSKFLVTPQGELHLTDGPGDLQTEKSFQDFCLHVECKTNGKLLNSGLFFRCLPGQYQQGYEAQIQNGFKDNDRTKPTDFGTGAIYRRIAARKVVPNDQEWFTMTVLAVGPRLRTWVNGEPTVDWVDERPANDNARNGRNLSAGRISIQGHDPTTDLLFKNIRIVEVAAP
jgi:hypothetical protein